MTSTFLIGLVHPVLMGLSLVLALYTLSSGCDRFRCLHLKQKRMFAWKRHVRFGTWAALLWIIGAPGGLLGAQLAFGVTFVSGSHAMIGCIMSVMAVFGLASGIYLDRVKKKRALLPALHGTNNVILLILTGVQAFSGFELLQMVWQM